jgi:hypothetical protein
MRRQQETTMVMVQLTLKMGGRRNRSDTDTLTRMLLEEFPVLSLEVATTTGTVLSLSAGAFGVRLTSTVLPTDTTLESAAMEP